MMMKLKNLISNCHDKEFEKSFLKMKGWIYIYFHDCILKEMIVRLTNIQIIDF